MTGDSLRFSMFSVTLSVGISYTQLLVRWAIYLNLYPTHWDSEFSVSLRMTISCGDCRHVFNHLIILCTNSVTGNTYISWFGRKYEHQMSRTQAIRGPAQATRRCSWVLSSITHAVQEIVSAENLPPCQSSYHYYALPLNGQAPPISQSFGTLRLSCFTEQCLDMI